MSRRWIEWWEKLHNALNLRDELNFGRKENNTEVVVNASSIYFPKPIKLLWRKLLIEKVIKYIKLKLQNILRLILSYTLDKNKILISINIVKRGEKSIVWGKEKKKFSDDYQTLYPSLILWLIIFNRRWKNKKIYSRESKVKSCLILKFIQKWRS